MSRELTNRIPNRPPFNASPCPGGGPHPFRGIPPPRGSVPMGSGPSRPPSVPRFDGSIHEHGLSLLKFRRDEGPNVDLRLLVPGKNAGAVIGKSASNIRRLRQTYNVAVNLSTFPTPDRILNISGLLGSVCATAFDAISAILRSADWSTPSDIRMLIHNSHAAVIIGKKGSRILNIRDETGARLYVFPEQCPQSTDQIVQLFGHPVNIVNCIGTILNLLVPATSIGPVFQYNPNNFDDSLASEYGGYTTPEMSTVLPTVLPPGIRPMRSCGPDGFGPPHPRFRGPPGHGFAPPGMMTPSHVPSPHPDIPFGAMDMKQEATFHASGIKSLKLSIPKKLVSAILGYRCCHVKNLRKESRADIIIEVPPAGAKEQQLLTINGTIEQIQRAQYIIQLKYLKVMGLTPADKADPDALPPRHERRERTQPDAPWITEEILTQKRLRQKAQRAWRLKPTEENRAELRKQTVKMQKMCRQTKDEYYSEGRPGSLEDKAILVSLAKLETDEDTEGEDDGDLKEKKPKVCKLEVQRRDADSDINVDELIALKQVARAIEIKPNQDAVNS